MTPNFSAYPFHALPRLSRRRAAIESVVARWIAARGHGDRLARLAGGAVRVDVVLPAAVFDPFAARCEVRAGGAAIEVLGTSGGVRMLAQRVLGGPNERGGPRPLTLVERSIWSLVVATALEDLGVAGEVWPQLVDTQATNDERTVAGHRAAGTDRGSHEPIVIELAVRLHDIALAVHVRAPASLPLRVPPVRPWPPWFETARIDAPIIVGRCALAKELLPRLAARSVVTLERPAGDAELVIFGGAVGLSAVRGALEAAVATGYVRRDMSLPDDAHVELTVALGTTQLSLRQVAELAVGQIVQLGRPLSGPFEVRAAGRVVGRGELVDVDGELAVRIVSLGD